MIEHQGYIDVETSDSFSSLGFSDVAYVHGRSRPAMNMDEFSDLRNKGVEAGNDNKSDPNNEGGGLTDVIDQHRYPTGWVNRGIFPRLTGGVVNRGPKFKDIRAEALSTMSYALILYDLFILSI